MATEVKKKPKKGAAKVRHLGRSKAKAMYRERYYSTVYMARKILHLLKNNSVAEAQSWAAKHVGGMAHFLKLVPRFRKEVEVENS